MLATISDLAHKPENIKKLFVFHELKLGFYVLRLFRNGKVHYMALDDLIPCHKTYKNPIFSSPVGNELWVILLEKAWAKSIGSYIKAEAMTPDHMM